MISYKQVIWSCAMNKLLSCFLIGFMNNYCRFDTIKSLLAVKRTEKTILFTGVATCPRALKALVSHVKGNPLEWAWSDVQRRGRTFSVKRRFLSQNMAAERSCGVAAALSDCEPGDGARLHVAVLMGMWARDWEENNNHANVFMRICWERHWDPVGSEVGG